ncbi:GH92 family glycosyl hydrolase [Granulicella sibirica]|uniref:Alpha-1,2-mannosidase n=1 Tax=Granulicella sibirica TaxID=2479048 RepID=A0A4Q0SUU3_9BACT|nr:GH92 family glycosyl hydrolase [Granulicella sibirica]RXH54092.1 Alpha-1,2-mannosidase [Granulicella sibirica]
MKAPKLLILIPLLLSSALRMEAQKRPVEYVNTFLGTAPLTNPADIGFNPPWRVWAGLVFPGASVPNAMVQLSPITKFGSGAGYEYENNVIYAFAHTNKGHWNLCNIPMLPVSGDVTPEDFGSPFSHAKESAHPGYYQVYLDRYGINAELTSTLRTGYHRYTYKDSAQPKKLIVNLARSNERIRDWKIEQDGDNAFKGVQVASEKVYFYAVSNYKIKQIEMLKGEKAQLPVVDIAGGSGPVEIRIGLSFVSMDNAKENLQKELGSKSFDTVKAEASATWQALLSKIQVSGGTERQKELFYSCLYRSFLWPALRSDVNGEHVDEKGAVVKANFQYYTLPSLWDDYRNKLVLLGMISPDVTVDVIRSLVERGEKTGFIPTFFHGDHAAPFIAGSYLRGLRGYDVRSAYNLLLRNATVEGGTRPYIREYMDKGFISDPDVSNPIVETKGKAGVTKTLEYSYDDYSVALLAKELNDQPNYDMLMKRSQNYKHMFDPSTGLMRGRLDNGEWIKNFNPQYPYYEYMYREANAWESSFFAPHDTDGLIGLYKSKADFEQHLDSLFTIPWNPNYIAENINSFIGQYCQGNQPDHSFPFLYYFVGKPEKSQAILNIIMSRFYGMGEQGLALSGMDDAGEMSSWYVFTAIGLYPYSPADPRYIVSVPLFQKTTFRLNEGKTLTILKKNAGERITGITVGGKKVNGYFVDHSELEAGKELVIATQ